jgi:hypothetical protein
VRRTRTTTALCIALLAASGASHAKKYASNILQQLPQGSVTVEGLTPATPSQKCENWLWAAEVETILKTQKIDLPQTYWVQKANLGEVCVDAPVELEAIASLIERDYQLEDGSKFHLTALRTVGAPTDMGHIISSLRQGRPFILLWKGHPLLVTGMVYDEYAYPNGQRMYEAVEIDMLDLLYPEGDERRNRSFVKGMDNLDEIGGALEVIASPVDHFRQGR